MKTDSSLVKEGILVLHSNGDQRAGVRMPGKHGRLAGDFPESFWVLTQKLLEELDTFPLALGHVAQKIVIISTHFHILKKVQKEEMAVITWGRTSVAGVVVFVDT